MYKLRAVRDSDHDWLVELHNDPQVLRNMTHPEPITALQHRVWWESIKYNMKQQREIFEVDGAPAGFAKFYDIDRTNRCCALGGDIHKEHRGKGLAKHMWGLMLKHCFEDLKLHRVSLTTAEYNEIGIKVYKTLGFLEEGRLVQSLFRDDKFYDQLCFYKLSGSA